MVYRRRKHPFAWLISLGSHALVVPTGLTAALMVGPDTPPPPPVKILMRPPAPPAPPPPPPPAKPEEPVEPEAPPEPVAPELLDTGPAAMSLDQFMESGAVGRTAGVVGGIGSGVMQNLLAAPEPPPPPPPEIIRVGGEIGVPELVRDVPPVYPPAAVTARLAGLVILELQVGTDGSVEQIDVLRSTSKLFEDPAETAMRERRYQPLVLDNTPQRFKVVVTVRFDLA